MRVGCARDDAHVGECLSFDTPTDPQDACACIAQEAKRLLGHEQVRGIVGGVAAPLNKERTIVGNAPNLPAWRGYALQGELEKRLHAPVRLENDAALAGLGEALFGAGKGYRIVMYMTVSTGVGGARIVEGKIDACAYGFEPGHQIIDIDGSLCPACNSVEAEGLLSGTATEIRFGKKAFDVKIERVWEELSLWLAATLNNSIVHWSPDVVVLGGPMITGDPAIPVDRVRYHLERILTIYPELPALVPATLTDTAALYGALAYTQDTVRWTHT